jgi:hypothetical protein
MMFLTRKLDESLHPVRVIDSGRRPLLFYAASQWAGPLHVHVRFAHRYASLWAALTRSKTSRAPVIESKRGTA